MTAKDRRIQLYTEVLQSRINSSLATKVNAELRKCWAEASFADGIVTAYKVVLGELESWNPK